MPELGKYAGAVLWSWAATLGLLAALILVTWLRARRSKAVLEAAEARAKSGKKEG